MNQEAALNLIKNTFENSFDRERFLIFAKNLFHFLDTDTFIYRGNLIPDAYDTHIKTLERLGKYEDIDGHKIEVLAVCLNKQSSLERARTLQRNFIAWYLNGSRGGITKDAALVAFYTKDSDDWRLSLVKMDYHLGESKAGKIKAITELTPARRFSFLVGASENTHTAQKQLLRIIKDTEFKPRLADLEFAFSVEVVTKDFFEKYKKLFLDTKEALDKIIAKDERIKTDFQEKKIDTADFAKKLLGQIVFLYFLQKKGWFGVEEGKDWGTGSKTFLRDLFDGKILQYKNFFNDILEPLFYDALSRDRSDVDFFNPQFNCKIPFLNGGLFDPLSGYDWTGTNINLPNSLFSNKKNSSDEGSGILDVFDLYNFTVKEDEPLEREVAVDPEMLGKVFENLLEVKDRKSKGTYYTPREIVHYMCQEGLINYLLTELNGKVDRDDIETLIRLGETAIESEALVIGKGYETKDHHFKLPSSIRNNAGLLDEKLEKIHVCDPAVGSGAFLVGMMTEVVRARSVLAPYLSLRGSEATKQSQTQYDFKRHAIQNCLYGVDIDPGAVEIAKLRLWLSLIVDEQDIKQIKPLPNLDYKIMQGNSLLEEYEGVKLDVDGDSQPQQIKFDGFKTESETLKDKLVELRKEFFKTAHKSEKDDLKKRIEDLSWQFIEASIKEQRKLSLLPEIERFKKANIKPFFLWKLNFSEVFEKNGGFDVVVANPPYVRISGIDESSDQTIRNAFVTAFAHYDLYIPFFEKGTGLLKSNGVLAFISPNKYLTKRYGNKLREFLLNTTCLLELVDTSQARTFDNASVYPIITILSKRKYETGHKTKVTVLDDSNFKPYFENIDSVNSYYVMPEEFRENDNFSFDIFVRPEIRKIFNKLKKDSNKLGDYTRILTGTPAIDKFYEWGKLIVSEDDLVNVKKKFRKFINVSNIKPYFIEWGKEIRAAKKRVKKPYLIYDEKLVGKNKWAVFEKKKVVIKGTSLRLTAAYDTEGFANLSLYAVIFKEDHDNYTKTLFHLALLNSNLLNFWYTKKFATSNVGGNYISFNGIYLEQIPIKNQSGKVSEDIIVLTEKILENTSNENYLNNQQKQQLVFDYQKKMDQLVYKLYGLTTKEVAIVEGNKS